MNNFPYYRPGPSYTRRPDRNRSDARQPDDRTQGQARNASAGNASAADRRAGQSHTGSDRQPRGSLAVRVDGFLLTQARDADGNPAAGEDGRPVHLARGVWGTSLCSGDKVLARLNTEEEEQSENFGRGIHPSRREVDQLRRLGRCDGPEWDPEALAEEERPVLLLDRVTPLVDEYGRARLTPRSDTDHSLHAQVRCGWMSGYFGGEDGDGRPFYPQAHMEAGRFSTVEVRLSQEPRPGDQPGYRQICQRARNAALRKGENSFFRIQSQAAGAVMDAWRQDRAEHPDIRFGTLHITTWYPEEHFRFGLEDRKGNGRRQLAAFLADSRFAAQPSEDGTPAPAAVTPELILRFLTEDGSVAGVWRCRPKDLAPSLQGADGEPISWQDAAKAQAERVFARFIGGLAPDYVKSRAITGVDVLPGRRYLCSRAVHTPSPLPDGSENRAAMTQLRSLLYLGLSQGEGVHQSQRFSIGCTQAFVPRGRHDHVLGWHQLRDGVSLRSAALLMPGGEMLVPAGAYREEVDREQSYMTGMTALLEESREDGPSAGMGTPDWSEDPEDNARGVETDRHMRACPAQVRAQVAEFASGSDGGRTAAGRAKDSRAAARAGSSATIRSAAAGAGRGDEDTGPRCA